MNGTAFVGGADGEERVGDVCGREKSGDVTPAGDEKVVRPVGGVERIGGDRGGDRESSGWRRRCGWFCG